MSFEHFPIAYFTSRIKTSAKIPHNIVAIVLLSSGPTLQSKMHEDVSKWKHFPRNEHGIHWSPGNSPHQGQWREALMVSLICDWINGLVNNRKAGDLRRHRAHYDVAVMESNYNSNLLINACRQNSWVVDIQTNRKIRSSRHIFIFLKVTQWLGAVSIRKTVLPGMAIPMLKIRRPNDRLIFNMEIAIRI